jgi:hypothetical protein
VTVAAAATTAQAAGQQQHVSPQAEDANIVFQQSRLYVLCISGDNNVVDCTFQTRKRCKMDDIFALVLFSLPFLIYLLGKYTFSTNKKI